MNMLGTGNGLLTSSVHSQAVFQMVHVLGYNAIRYRACFSVDATCQ